MAVASSGRPGRDGGSVGAARAFALNVVGQHLANLLTLARLACTLPIVLLIGAGRFDAAFYLFLIAAMSDVLDGYIAKRFSGCSPVGAILDPAADKVLTTSLFVALWIIGAIPMWFVMLIVIRDLLIIGGAALLRRRVRGFRIEPLVIGKLCTFSQLVLAGFVLGQLAGMAEVGWALEPLLLTAAAVTVASAAVYLGSALRLTAASDGTA